MSATSDKTEVLNFRRYKDGDSKLGPLEQADLPGQPLLQVPDLHPVDAALPGQLPLRRGHPRLPEHRARRREAAGRRRRQAGRCRSGIRLAPPDGSQPLPLGDGPRLPGALRDRLQPQCQVEDHVGINSVEHFLGEYAIQNKLKFAAPETKTGKKVAVIGGGPAGLSAAYQLARMGHEVTIFDEHEFLGGMMRYGIPGFRTPREVLDAEIQRILDLGVKAR
jgi:NADPH-dependent 2,4-dienoyl-CoA reductase/sulfur reductase-like enzyme